MALISDVFVFGAAAAAALYCFILSRRIKKLNDLDKGLGGAIASFSANVEQLEQALKTARTATDVSLSELSEICHKSEVSARRLELLLATLDDQQLGASRQ